MTPWLAASPATTVGEFSAACFYMARELQKTVNVPMGLINSSWGGSRIQAWMSAEALRSVGGYDASLDLLNVQAKDATAGIARWGEMWQAWWRARVPNTRTVGCIRRRQPKLEARAQAHRALGRMGRPCTREIQRHRLVPHSPLR